MRWPCWSSGRLAEAQRKPYVIALRGWSTEIHYLGLPDVYSPEFEELAAYGEFKYTEFARVPVAFVVSPQAGVKNLSEAQICAIYKGMLTNWKEAGGHDLPIRVQARPDAGSTSRKHSKAARP